MAVAGGQDLYDESTVPVLQLKFSQANWWAQLQAYYQTKTNIPATLIVDGVGYEGVGVRFRRNTSYQMTGTSQKKSFNIEIDFTIPDQRLMGYKTLNLLNCADDATFMREVLYSNTCRRQIPSAKANFVRLEINGENWGIYAIVLNEVMAKNKSTLADPQGEFDDWIELKNVSDQTVDLSGMYLTDSADRPLKWQFPQGTQLAPGEYLIVWADEDGGDEPGLHANFRLAADGETVWLYDAARNGYMLLDCATFEGLGTDQSLARYPDGTRPMQVSSAPSPLGPNATTKPK